MDGGHSKLPLVARWEYKTLTFSGPYGPDMDELEARMNELGVEGWEFVETFVGPHNDGRMLFRRELQDQ